MESDCMPHVAISFYMTPLGLQELTMRNKQNKNKTKTKTNESNSFDASNEDGYQYEVLNDLVQIN